MAIVYVTFGMFSLAGIVAAIHSYRLRHCQHEEVEQDAIGDLRCCRCGLDLSR